MTDENLDFESVERQVFGMDRSKIWGGDSFTLIPVYLLSGYYNIQYVHMNFSHDS